MPDKTKLTKPLAGLTGCYVAGGAITSLYTNKPIADLDIYPKSHEALEGAIRWAFEDSGMWNTDASSRALTFGTREQTQVQIMHFDVFPSPKSIFDAFDFTCCMGAFDLDTEKFTLDKRFLEHCSQRFLSFNPGTRFPYASAWRVRKYEEKGFTIGKMEFHKILMACAQRPITSWDDLREQIGGVYGEAFDIPTDEPFSIAAAHKAMSTLRFEEGSRGYGSADEAIVMTSPVERDYFVVEREGKRAVFVRIDGDFEKVSAEPKCGRLVSLEEAFPNLAFYKKVRKENGRLRSNWKSSFSYPLGEVVSSDSPFIYAYRDLDGARNHYSGHGPGHAIIELRALSAEDVVIDDNGTIRLKRCRVHAEHPQDAEMEAA